MTKSSQFGSHSCEINVIDSEQIHRKGPPVVNIFVLDVVNHAMGKHPNTKLSMTSANLNEIL